jgi:hypothetical protein
VLIVVSACFLQGETFQWLMAVVAAVERHAGSRNMTPQHVFGAYDTELFLSIDAGSAKFARCVRFARCIRSVRCTRLQGLQGRQGLQDPSHGFVFVPRVSRPDLVGWIVRLRKLVQDDSVATNLLIY